MGQHWMGRGNLKGQTAAARSRGIRAVWVLGEDDKRTRGYNGRRAHRAQKRNDGYDIDRVMNADIKRGRRDAKRLMDAARGGYGFRVVL